MKAILLGSILTVASLLRVTAQDHTLVVETKGKKVSYALNGVETPLAKLLDKASEIVAKEPGKKVVIIFDSSISLDAALNAKRVFNKVGYQNVTLFVRSRITDKMSEVSFGPPVPCNISSQ